MTLFNVKARVLAWYDESLLARRRQLKALERIAAAETEPEIEHAAKLLHNVRHPLGYAPVCGKCRQDARIVAWGLANNTHLKEGPS